MKTPPLEKNDLSSQMVSENMGLVHMIAKRYLGFGTEYEDLVQIGSIGLFKAVKSFDEEKGTMFSTYAVTKIVGEIKSFLRDSGPVKVSRSVKETGYKISKTAEKLSKELGREPKISEISEKLGISSEDIIFAMEANAKPYSLDTPISGDDDDKEGSLFDVVGENHEENRLDKLLIYEALRYLDANERKIIVLRYFSDKTQSEIAEILGVSQVQISRQEKKILEKLKLKLE